MMKSLFTYILSLIILLAPASGMAAFEFTPPDRESATAQAQGDDGDTSIDEPRQEAAPSSPVEVNDIAPPTMSQPLPAPLSTSPTRQAVQTEPKTLVAKQPTSRPNFETVEGFASDIPMILALREIVPNDYGFSFAKGIDLGQRISWEGGRIWPAILEDVLAPADLDFRISGKIVRIEPAGSQPEPDSQMATGSSVIQQEIKRRRARRNQSGVQGTPALATAEDNNMKPAMELSPTQSSQPAPKGSQAPSRDRIASLLRDDQREGVVDDIDQTNLSTPPAEIRQRQRIDQQRRQKATAQPQSMMVNQGQSARDFDQILQDQQEMGMTTANNRQDDVNMPTKLARSNLTRKSGPDPLTVSDAPVNGGNQIPAKAPISKVNNVAETVTEPEQTSPQSTMKNTSSVKPIATPVMLWRANPGDMLRDTLADWAERENIQLNWQADHDFELEAQVRIRGDFQEAVRTLLSGLQNTDPRPIGRLHPNKETGDPVLIIQTQRING
jgi:hypothetical protein